MRSSHIFSKFEIGVFVVIVLSMLSIRTARAATTPAIDAEAIFKASCSGCHGPQGSANSPAAKLLKLRDLRSPEVLKQTDAQLYAITAKGSKNMPPFERSLGKAKIQALVSYLRGFSKKK